MKLHVVSYKLHVVSYETTCFMHSSKQLCIKKDNYLMQEIMTCFNLIAGMLYYLSGCPGLRALVAAAAAPPRAR